MSSVTKTERAHQKYRAGEYGEALDLYTEALNAATQLNHQIALHSNRAACHLKLQQYKLAAEECSAVLELDAKHAGALMLRAQTLVAMKDYHSALFDVNRLLEANPTSEVYRNLQSRLKTQMALAPIPEAEHETPPDSPTRLRKLPALAEPPKPAGWATIPKPKGHTGVDYSRWSSLGDDLSSDEDDDDDDDDEPQFQYRLSNVGLSNFQLV